MSEDNDQSLPQGWRRVRAEEVALQQKGAIVSGPFGSNIGKRFFVESGVPVIRGSSLTLGLKEFVDDGFVFLTEEKASEFRGCQALHGDIIFTAAGTLGQVGRIPDNARFPLYIISNKQLRLRCDPAIADSKYLYCWFSSPAIRTHIANHNTGASVPLITLTTLRNLPVNLPPLPVQRRIAGILSAYDELMENSQRRIRLLEAMARALYREWFVHFRFPGHEKHPRVPSPLGDIPQGWEVKSIQQFGTVITGKTPSKANADFYGDDVPFVKTPDMHGNMFILGTSDCLSTAGAESQANKTLPAGSICVSCIGTIGVVSITTEDCQTNQQINSVVLANPASREFLFLRLQDSKQALENLGANGATMGNVNKGKFEAMEIVCPSEDVLARYHRLVEPMFSQILSLFRQIQSLRRTRDLLLPRLLSGQVELKTEAA
jgi:type I restriction enzyme S subunit